MKLNESSQFEATTIRIDKALPLIWAAKLAKRVAGYARPCLELANRPTFTNETPMQRQDMMRDHVVLNLSDPADPDRCLPWKKELDRFMFYL